MDQFFDVIYKILKEALQYLYEIFIVVMIETVVEFFKDVIEYFKTLGLNRKKHTAFFMKTNNDIDSPIASLIPDELKGRGIVEGVYNKETDKIDSIRYIGGNGISEEVEETMKDKPIVVFS